MRRLRLAMLAGGVLSQQWPPVLGTWALIELVVMFWHLFTDNGG